KEDRKRRRPDDAGCFRKNRGLLSPCICSGKARFPVFRRGTIGRPWMTMDVNKDVRRKYSTAISKGAGMIEETRRLLEYWRPGEPLDDFTRRVQEDGLLGNSTAYRTRDVVRRVFAPRFLKPTDKPARILKHVLSSGMAGRVFT